MKKTIYRCLTAMMICFMVGCSGGGGKSQKAEDMIFGELHASYLPELSLQGDCSQTFQCMVDHESGTLDHSELDLDLMYDGTTLHMPLFDADTYLEHADGTIHTFTDEEKAKGRKEAGSVYSTNKVPSNGVKLTITLSRAGDVISGKATYEGGAMGKGDHQFWLYHYYSETPLPENLTLNVSGQNLNMTKIQYTIE